MFEFDGRMVAVENVDEFHKLGPDAKNVIQIAEVEIQ